jgi:hypothetical protein
MKDKYIRRFFDAPTDDAGGGGGDMASDVGSETNSSVFDDASLQGSSGAAIENEPETVTPEVKPASETPAPATANEWTPDKVKDIIAQAAAAGAQQARPQEQAQAPKQYTQEDIDKFTNAFKASPELIGELLEGGEKSLGAMSQIIEGVVKQATTISWLQSQMLQKQMNQEMNPVMEYYRGEQVKQLRNEFFDAHADLKGQDKLLSAVKVGIDQERILEGKTKEEAFKIIADRAREVLSANGANGANGNGAQQKPAAQQPKMATLSRGSQHGAAASAGAGGASPKTAEVIFG